MLVLSMNVSVDGFISDRDGGLDWGAPGEELFRFHTDQVRRLRGFLIGRRLYETMLVWETDPSLRASADGAAFADAWAAIPKVVFSRTLRQVQGNARLATASLGAEAGAMLAAADSDVAIGGADLAGQAIGLGLLDELRIVRHPVVVGGGTPLLPPVERPLPLELLETRTLGGGVVLERYGLRRR